MVTLSIQPYQGTADILYLIQSAVDGEIANIEIALKLAMNRLSPFEQKYGVSSDFFINQMTAEDLKGGDDEYISWAGEYKLMIRLREKFDKLNAILS